MHCFLLSCALWSRVDTFLKMFNACLKFICIFHIYLQDCIHMQCMYQLCMYHMYVSVMPSLIIPLSDFLDFYLIFIYSIYLWERCVVNPFPLGSIWLSTMIHSPHCLPRLVFPACFLLHIYWGYVFRWIPNQNNCVFLVNLSLCSSWFLIMLFCA